MTILDELKELIVKRGGETAGVHRISDALDVIGALEDAANPLSALKVDVTVGASTDLLGKVIGDLQTNVVIGADKITGELYYIDDYTQFGAPEEQEGHYLVTHTTVPNVDGVTITSKINTKDRVVTLDSDGILILRVTDEYIKAGLKLYFTASKSGYESYTRVFDLTGLTLDPETD